MIEIPLQAVPNQSLSFTLNDNTYDMTIRACNTADAEVMGFDIAINNEIVVQGQRATTDFPIIPYVYLYNGNFVLVTADDDLPDWRKFGISQYLIYISNDEIREIYASST